MRTKTCLFTLLFGAWCGSSGTAMADDVTVGGIRYETNENAGTAKAMPLDDGLYSGDITVPASFTYDGKTYSVTEVDDEMFRYNTDVTSVVLQVQPGEFFSFQGCTALKSVSLPDGMTELQGTFNGCSSLEDVRFPADLQKLGSGTFSGCTSLKSITIPASVKEMTYGVFNDCPSLTELAFAESKDSLIIDGDFTNLPVHELRVGRNLSFYGFSCPWNTSTLETADVSGQTTTIPSSMFQGCTGLTRAAIGESVTTIKSDAFSGCTALQSIVIPSGVDSIEMAVFTGCTNLQSVRLEEGATVIGEYMFLECTSLSNVELPSTLTTIGNGAFKQCALETVCLPASVDSIGEYAFQNCTALKSVELPAGLKALSRYVFNGCTSLGSIVLPDGLETIGYSAFSNCTAMTSITMGDKIKSVGDGAFVNCEALADVCYKGSLSGWMRIDMLADTYPEETCPLSFASRLYVDYGTDDQQIVTDLVVPEDITAVKDYAFAGYKGLTSAVFPAHVKEIGREAFSYCTQLAQAEIHAQRIGGYAFFYCNRLKNVVIGKEVNFIGAMSFNYVNPTQTQYEGTLDEWCRIYFASASANPSASGKLYIGGSEICSELVLPSTLTSVGQYAFYRCWSITSLVIPENIREIGESAFSNCPNLVSVTVASPAKKAMNTLAQEGLSLGDYAFQGCTKLADINLSASLTGIGTGAFDGTAWLNAQPDGVVYLSTFAYKYKVTMAEGTTLALLDGTTDVCGRAFNNCWNLAGIDLPESLKTIGKEAFSGTGLLSVSLPSRIDSIGESAFSGCDKLVSATLPENLTTIPASMFSRCYALAAISIPASVEYIGDEAFYSCLGLKEITSFNPVPPVCEPFYGENWTMVFDGVNPEHCTLKIPTGSTASYAAAVGWDMFYLCEEFDPSGIQGVLKGKASGKTVHYDLNGRMIPSNAKGIHIVREADGSCRKIWVK